VPTSTSGRPCLVRESGARSAQSPGRRNRRSEL
jgi:hypothetical protein